MMLRMDGYVSFVFHLARHLNPEGCTEDMDEEELANLLTLLEEGLIKAGMSSLVKSRTNSAVEGRVEELQRGTWSSFAVNRLGNAEAQQLTSKSGTSNTTPNSRGTAC